MYEVRFIAAIKGMENGIEHEVSMAIEDALEEVFGKYGVWEVFVFEVEERIVGDKIGN